MSTYDKPVKQCQDAPLGFRTVNQLTENQDAARALLELEHKPTPEAPPFVSPGGNIGGGGLNLANLDVIIGGEHDTPKVARGTIGLDVDPNLLTFGAAVVVVRRASPVCSSVFRVGTGVYFFPIVGLSDVYGEATAIAADDTTFRHCDVKVSSTVTLSNATTVIVAPGVFVYCWEETTLESTNVGFDLADFSFDITVYGNRNTDLSEWEPVVASSPAHVRRRRWRPRSGVFKPL